MVPVVLPGTYGMIELEQGKEWCYTGQGNDSQATLRGSKRNNEKPVHTAEGRVVPCLEVVLVEGAGRLDLVCVQP